MAALEVHKNVQLEGEEEEEDEVLTDELQQGRKRRKEVNGVGAAATATEEAKNIGEEVKGGEEEEKAEETLIGQVEKVNGTEEVYREEEFVEDRDFAGEPAPPLEEGEEADEKGDDVLGEPNSVAAAVLAAKNEEEEFSAQEEEAMDQISIKATFQESEAIKDMEHEQEDAEVGVHDRSNLEEYGEIMVGEGSEEQVGEAEKVQLSEGINDVEHEEEDAEVGVPDRSNLEEEDEIIAGEGTEEQVGLEVARVQVSKAIEGMEYEKEDAEVGVADRSNLEEDDEIMIGEGSEEGVDKVAKAEISHKPKLLKFDERNDMESGEDDENWGKGLNGDDDENGNDEEDVAVKDNEIEEIEDGGQVLKEQRSVYFLPKEVGGIVHGEATLEAIKEFQTGASPFSSATNPFFQGVRFWPKSSNLNLRTSASSPALSRQNYSGTVHLEVERQPPLIPAAKASDVVRQEAVMPAAKASNVVRQEPVMPTVEERDVAIEETVMPAADESHMVVDEYDLEKIIEEQETHDLYCPNCNSCITKRVVLRKRKRTVREVAVPERGIKVPRREESTECCEAFTCFSCFSVLFPTDFGFRIWPMFRNRESNVAPPAISPNEAPSSVVVAPPALQSVASPLPIPARVATTSAARDIGTSGMLTAAGPSRGENNICGSASAVNVNTPSVQENNVGGSVSTVKVNTPSVQVADSNIPAKVGPKLPSAQPNQIIDNLIPAKCSRDSQIPGELNIQIDPIVTDNVEDQILPLSRQPLLQMDPSPLESVEHLAGEAAEVLQPAVSIQTAPSWDVLKSLVYGGLAESITSLSVVSSAASAGSSTLNILIIGLAALAGGFPIIINNVFEQKKLSDATRESDDQTSCYFTQLGRRSNFGIHLIVAAMSFVLFGTLLPLVYFLSFRDSGDRDYKLLATAGVGLLCVGLLSAMKAHVKPQKTWQTYVTTVLTYVSLGVTACGLSYVAGEVIAKLLEAGSTPGKPPPPAAVTFGTPALAAY